MVETARQTEDPAEDPAEDFADRRFDIGELAALVGLGTSALRYYEREGLLEPAGRAGGRRYYDERGLMQLAAILYWQEAGLTLREMTRLFHEAEGDIDAVKNLARSRIADLETLIEHATYVRAFLTHVLDCTHARVGDCPEYQTQIRERATKIAADNYRHHGHPRLRATRPATGTPEAPSTAP